MSITTGPSSVGWSARGRPEERLPLPEGTLLYGQLWTEGISKLGDEAVMGRYTEALLPDGRRVPICFSLNDSTGLIFKLPGSKPGAVVLRRRSVAFAVEQWR